MPKFPVLKMSKREVKGRKVKALRRQGLIPANVFGRKIDSVAVQVDESVFAKLFESVGETGIVEVDIEDNKYPCLIVGRAVDPVTGRTLHVDFHNVSLKEKVTATIPVELTGEAPAVKEQGGVLSQSLYELEVEALPTNLPESINVDVSILASIGDVISVKDLKIDDSITLTADPETAVVSVVEQVEEEPEPVAEEIVTETTVQGTDDKEAVPDTA